MSTSLRTAGRASRPFAATAAGVATGLMALIAGATAIGTSAALLAGVASFGEPSRLVLVARAPQVRPMAGAATALAFATNTTGSLRK